MSLKFFLFCCKLLRIMPEVRCVTIDQYGRVKIYQGFLQ